MQYKYYRHNQGFTLVELITVIVILGILTTVGASKFFNNATFKATQYHQELLSAARYAQKIAIASQNNVAINFSANDYSLCYSTSCSPVSSDVKHPANQDKYTNPVPDGVSMDDDDVPKTIYFDAAGEANNSLGKITSKQKITINNMGSIYIEAVTGYVHE